jgi:hypothetical protein
LFGAPNRFVSFGLLATPCGGTPAIPSQEICRHVHPNCDGERTIGVSKMMQNSANFGFEPIKFSPFGFGAPNSVFSTALNFSTFVCHRSSIVLNLSDSSEQHSFWATRS